MPPEPLVFDLEVDPIPAYKEKLQETHPGLLALFEIRLRECPGAAHLEAYTFTIFKVLNLNPQIHERPDSGGADFRMLSTPAQPIYAECKYIDRRTVAAMSGLSDDEQDGVQTYSQITPKLQSTIGEAVPQLSLCSDGPGVAVVGTDHLRADMVMGWWAAEKLLTSTTVLRVPISQESGHAVGPIHEFAALRDSAFLRPAQSAGEDLDRRRLPASAALMLAFNTATRRVHAMGVLNPWPVRAIDHRHFARIPFARFSQTPSNVGASLPAVEFINHAE